MTQVKEWLGLNIFDFYGKVEAWKKHMKKKIPVKPGSGVNANTSKKEDG